MNPDEAMSLWGTLASGGAFLLVLLVVMAITNRPQ